MSSEFIQPDEVKTVLQTSGYLLEGRVAAALEAEHFIVQMNTFQPDPRDTTKSIEIDVLGIFAAFLDAEATNSVCVTPLIECKNNSQPVAFFLKKESMPDINQQNIIYHGFPLNSPDAASKIREPTHQLLEMWKWHHYCAVTETAGQFCGFKRIGEDQSGRKNPSRAEWLWKDERMQNYSESFTNLIIAATNYDVDASFEGSSIELAFCYPVVVFQGPIYGVRVNGADVDVSSEHWVQLRHSTTVGGRLFSAQIDIVTETYFPTLMKTIVRELEQLRHGMIQNYDSLKLGAIAEKQLARQRYEESP